MGPLVTTKTTDSSGQVYPGTALTSLVCGRDLSRALAGKVLTACRQNSSEKSAGMEQYHYHAAIFSPSGFEAESHLSWLFIGWTMSHVQLAYISTQTSQ